MAAEKLCFRMTSSACSEATQGDVVNDMLHYGWIDGRNISWQSFKIHSLGTTKVSTKNHGKSSCRDTS